jgi:hypothetical protein
MSNECTGDWDTTARLDKTPGVTHLRGVVHVNNHAGASITGEFRPQAGAAVPLINGKCHPIPGQRRSLSFHITIGGETLAFRGIIDPVNSPNVILCGAFVIVIGPPDPGDTGTWEATKGGLVPGANQARAGTKKRRPVRRS